MGAKVRLSYDELSLAWRAIHKSLATIADEKLRLTATSRAFSEMLPRVGWTLKEWNAETAEKKAAKNL